MGAFAAKFSMVLLLAAKLLVGSEKFGDGNDGTAVESKTKLHVHYVRISSLLCTRCGMRLLSH